MSKQELRRFIKQTMQQLDANQKVTLSREISKKLESFLSNPLYIQKEIGAFFPLEDEADWTIECPIVDEDLLSFPLMRSDSIEPKMIFKKSKIKELTETKAFGRTFRQPLEIASEVDPKIIIMPGLAFDREGNRLGRGKGFYDRFLSEGKYIKIGICFHDQLVDEVPVDSFDIPVDFIITDKEILEV